MPDHYVVLLKTMVMFLVMAIGWAARRRAYITTATTQVMSRLVVDIVFPCLVFTQLLRTVNPGSLRQAWYVPLLGVGVILLAALVAVILLAPLRRSAPLSSMVFLAALPNWIFLPLPIASALYGDMGVRDVLLVNVGAQLALWSLGVWILRGARPDIKSLRNLLKNPGLLATAGGILLAIWLPGARELQSLPQGVGGGGHFAAAVMVQTMAMLGELTIPLALLITGAQLGGLRAGRPHGAEALIGVTLVRLLAAPAATVACMRLLACLGLVVPDATRITIYLIACMPVAISASIMTDRYGGDNLLSARAVFLSTLCSILTVPAFYWLVRTGGF
ncbi:MAG: AEC family transporter [Kiritimatiellia bacterium]